jgi:hypothetical protein
MRKFLQGLVGWAVVALLAAVFIEIAFRSGAW